MKKKFKVIGFAGLVVGAIIALSAIVSECHDVCEKAKEVKAQSDRVKKMADEMKLNLN